MDKYIVRIDKEKNEAIVKLMEYGAVEKISILLNLFTIVTLSENINEIQQIDGVIYVEADSEGELKKIAI